MMTRNGLVVLLVCALSLAFGTGQGCIPPSDGGGDNGGGDNGGGDNGGGDNGGGDNGGGDNGGGDNGGGDNGGGDSSALSVVLTSILHHVEGRASAGDDIIVYTATESDGTPGGVDYIVPSAGDTTGRGIPGGPDFNDDSFAVAGKKIALVGGPTGDDTFKVTIFDTTTGTASEVPLTDVRLVNIPVDPYDAGHIQADGTYVVTRNDASSVNDGNIIKVIDISGATPVVISFQNPTGVNSGFQIPQVLVDADTNTAVAVTDSAFHVYDITSPASAPTTFDVSGSGGIGADGNQFAYANGVILYIDDTTDENAFYLDVTNAGNTPVQFTQNADTTSGRFWLLGAAYGYLWSAPASAGLASAIGTIPNAAPTLADTSDAGLIAGNTANQGRFGFGQSIAIGTLNGATTWFIAGSESISTPQPLQYSTTGGLNWNLVTDPADASGNLKASDVETNAAGTLLAFKHGVDTDTLLGYAILN